MNLIVITGKRNEMDEKLEKAISDAIFDKNHDEDSAWINAHQLLIHVMNVIMMQEGTEGLYSLDLDGRFALYRKLYFASRVEICGNCRYFDHCLIHEKTNERITCPCKDFKFDDNFFLGEKNDRS